MMYIYDGNLFIVHKDALSDLLLCDLWMILCSDEAACVHRGGHTDAGASWDCGSGGSFPSEVCVFGLFCMNQS